MIGSTRGLFKPAISCAILKFTYEQTFDHVEAFSNKYFQCVVKRAQLGKVSGVVGSWIHAYAVFQEGRQALVADETESGNMRARSAKVHRSVQLQLLLLLIEDFQPTKPLIVAPNSDIPSDAPQQNSLSIYCHMYIFCSVPHIELEPSCATGHVRELSTLVSRLESPCCLRLSCLFCSD